MQNSKNNTLKYTISFMLAFLALILLGSGLGYMMAYFTATAKVNGNMTFANLNLNLMKNGGELTQSTYTSSYMSNLYPGSKISMNDIQIKNTGDISCYALINYKLNISKEGVNTISYSTWYNLDGELVNSANLSDNITEATLINANESKNLSLYYVLSGKDITNDYEEATITTTLTACGIQSEYLAGGGISSN